VFDSGYSAQKIAKLLNSGNVSWDVGTGARYHRVEKNGKLIAEIESPSCAFAPCCHSCVAYKVYSGVHQPLLSS